MFLVFVLCKNNTCDPKDRAYFEPRAIIWTFFVEVHNISCKISKLKPLEL
jgi:hypothetical protein